MRRRDTREGCVSGGGPRRYRQAIFPALTTSAIGQRKEEATAPVWADTPGRDGGEEELPRPQRERGEQA
jgi:hypothetical protein